MSKLLDRLSRYSDHRLEPSRPRVEGRITRMIGLTIEAVGIKCAVGECCFIELSKDQQIEAEVVGFSGDRIYLMPLYPIDGLQAGTRVIASSESGKVPVGMTLLGRILNGVGKPIDGKGPLQPEAETGLTGEIINPLMREPIKQPLDVGIRTINGLLTVGRGQRMGLFAGSGVGKSVLLGMMTRFTEAEIIVVGLIGERGREVKEFIEHSLGAEGLKRSVVVASPADDSPLMRLRASQLSTRIAEYFRDQGKNVLLLMDSLTRYAQAQREIALAVGEPPATKGYPPSVFAKIPKLVERAGNGEEGGGSITAFYTVLTEGDDQQDPVADSARAILDGHVVLSRQLAEQGHYPAIDIEASISRAMPQIIDADHLTMAMRFKQLYSKYRQNEDLINVGAYVKGSDPDTDFVMENLPSMTAYLRQGINESFQLIPSMQQMVMVLSPPPSAPEQNQQLRRPVTNGLQK
ncbi:MULTISPECIES: flagellar protein export ATPase FliI [unclassified Neptuniibacter]|uniref:flagellar protein export ATPase FliI n=1 Tax=unclassified Neptuniibacter TaxID=2630693 RepID=UPI0025DA1750|nr:MULTISPECIES: flagellar protein export ATPase FliI [unclassified Neptuniibacter]|tara:strand:- start:20549 stop:21937 length:1389 start_codon:yes stop_codon:yes gene_type:complete